MSQLLPVSQFPAAVIKLDNGLTIIHQELSTTSVAVVDVWVRAGASAEPEDWFGMAHFLEHMIFKGTERLIPGDFDRVVESRGGISNAATSHDYVHYFITAASHHLQDTLPHLADLLLHASIPDDEFIREREVVLEEIRQSQDDLDMLGFQALVETVYQHHPYGRPILGTEAQLMQHSPDSMRCFHRAHYQPENMTVVMVGGIDQEQAVELVSQAFNQFSTRSDCPPPKLEAEPPITQVRRQELYLPRLEQARLMLAWIGPGLSSAANFVTPELSYTSHPTSHFYQQLQHACGLDLISLLLTEGRSSRLVRELREDRRLVQDISSGFSLQQDSSLFTITVWLEPEDVDRVEAIICDRLSELMTLPISDAELARCKRLLCNDFIFSTETPGQLAGLYGYYNTIAQAEMAIIYPDQIQSLQADDLQRLARQYLSPYHYAATILKPL